jgi:hypothetical protein
VRAFFAVVVMGSYDSSDSMPGKCFVDLMKSGRKDRLRGEGNGERDYLTHIGKAC